jgi:hypothetical protein
MSSLFWISYGLLWVTVLVTGVLVFLLLREIGRIYLAQTPGSAREGVAVGRRLPDLRLGTTDGDVRLRALLDGADHTVVLIASSGCGLCPEAAEALGEWVRAAPALGGVVLVDGDGWESYASNAALDAAQLPAGAMNRELELSATPFAFVVDRELKVLSKGIVNNEGHIVKLLRESKVEALDRLTRVGEAPLSEMQDRELVTVVAANGAGGTERVREPAGDEAKQEEEGST